MGVGSRLNPNYPIPGLDQSSKGFRDNFAIIKREIEGLQGTTIQLTGGVVSEPVQIGDGGAMVIPTAVDGSVIALTSPAQSIQYNKAGLLNGSASFVFNDATSTVGIRTNSPDVSMALDAAGPGRFARNLTLTQDNPLQPAMFVLETTDSTLQLRNNWDYAQVGTVTAIPFHVMTGQINRISVSAAGNVGIGSSVPTVALDVRGTANDVARFRNSIALVDSVIRASTVTNNSTIGFGVEHLSGNQLGGLRIDNIGTVSIHSGESAGAGLSSSSARISIDFSGKVGIGSNIPVAALDVNGGLRTKGITDKSDGVVFAVGINNKNPEYEIDVVGEVAATGAYVSKPPYSILGTTLTVIDAWPINIYRTARYMIQITRGVSPNEFVDIVDYLLYHVNGTVVGTQLSRTTSGGTLGTITVALVSGYAELRFAGNSTNTIVKVDKKYITTTT